MANVDLRFANMRKLKRSNSIMETFGIEKYGITSPKSVNRNLSPAVLTETALKTEKARLTDKGALLIETGK